MPTPTISGLQVTFPANSKYIKRSGKVGSMLYPINVQTVTLDACASGSETTRIYWKQGTTGNAFANLPPLAFVGRTAISGVTVIKDVQGGGTPTAVPAGNIKTHVRGKVYTDLVVSNPLQQADVTYSYKRERYDLLELDIASGVVYVVKGVEHDFYAAQEKPIATAGRMPLFYAYVWNDTVELIVAGSGNGLGHPVGSIGLSNLLQHKTRNKAILASVRTKLNSGSPVVAQFYGDSITAQGGGWAATGGADDSTYMATAPAGHARDNLGYLTYRTAQLDTLWGPYPTGWIDANDDGSEAHETNGWAYKLSAAIDAKYPSAVTFENWGIGATSCATGIAASGAPNGSNPTRLNAIAAQTGDVIFINFGMNDFVGFATGGLRAALVAIVTALQAAQPSRKVVLMGAPGINSENPNGNAGAYTWWYQHQATYQSVALEMGCAYVPMELIYHGSPAFLGISQQHFSGVNRYNHPGPFELTKIKDFVMYVLGF